MEYAQMEYAQIEKQMKLWREGLVSFPNDYIEYHRILAENAVTRLRERGYTIHRKWTDRDGWMDGMMTTFLVVETPSGGLKKLTWHDAHSKGLWFEQHQSGGSSPHYANIG